MKLPRWLRLSHKTISHAEVKDPDVADAVRELSENLEELQRTASLIKERARLTRGNGHVIGEQ